MLDVVKVHRVVTEWPVRSLTVRALSNSSQRRRYGGHLLIREGAHIESDQVVLDAAEHTRLIQAQPARQLRRAQARDGHAHHHAGDGLGRQ